MPYELALSGYVVVAPDYQGLGVNTTASGELIYHPYLSGPASANDLFYAVQAAQEAFPDKLSKEFVISGHSQGGNSAWASAVRQKNTPVDGYLGVIAGSPVTNITSLIALLSVNVPPSLTLVTAQSVRAFYPDFDESKMLTAEGSARLQLARNVSMCNSAFGALLEDFPASDNGTLVKQNWTNLPELQQYLAASDIGNQQIAGPMLVLQGTSDQAVPSVFTDASVALTCEVNGGSGIEYYRFENVTHVPVLYASKRIWLDWLARRFSSVGQESTEQSCSITNVTAGPWPQVNYQAELNYYLEWANQAYQVA